MHLLLCPAEFAQVVKRESETAHTIGNDGFDDSFQQVHPFLRFVFLLHSTRLFAQKACQAFSARAMISALALWFKVIWVPNT